MNVSKKFRAHDYTEENVGRMIKSSKQKYTWKFDVHGKRCHLILKVSKVTNNYSVEVNEQLVYKGNKTYDNKFEFKIKIEDVNLLIRNIDNEYNLYIDKIPFVDFYYDDKAIKEKIDYQNFTLYDDKINNIQDPNSSININMDKHKPINGHEVIKSEWVNYKKDATSINSINYIDDDSFYDRCLSDEEKMNVKSNEIEQQNTREDVNTPDEKLSKTFRHREITFKYQNNCEKRCSCYKNISVDYDYNSNTACKDHRSFDHQDPSLKESMEVFVYPNDFQDYDDHITNMIKKLYN